MSHPSLFWITDLRWKRRWDPWWPGASKLWGPGCSTPRKGAASSPKELVALSQAARQARIDFPETSSYRGGNTRGWDHVHPPTTQGAASDVTGHRSWPLTWQSALAGVSRPYGPMWIGSSWFPRSVVLSLVECGASARKLVVMQASSWRGCLVEAEGTFSAILCSRGHSIPDEDVHGWALWPLQSRLFLKVDSEPNSDRSLCWTSLWCYLHGIGWSGRGSLALSLWDADPGPHLDLPSFCAGGCHGGRSDRASSAREMLVGQPEWQCFSFFPCSPREDVSPGTRTQAGVFSVPFCAHGRVRRIAFLIEIHWVCF